MHLYNPVTQAVHNEFAHNWMVAVEGVATATVVVVLPLGSQHVIDTVV